MKIKTNLIILLMYYHKLPSNFDNSANLLNTCHVWVGGRSCEPNNQLNVCTTSVTEGEVARVKLV